MVDTLSSDKPNLRISDLHYEKLVTNKRHVVMQHAVNRLHLFQAVLNSVWASMVKNVNQWPWSNHLAMIGKSSHPEWLQTDWILGAVWQTTEAGATNNCEKRHLHIQVRRYLVQHHRCALQSRWELVHSSLNWEATRHVDDACASCHS